jgi:hypothetical protein
MIIPPALPESTPAYHAEVTQQTLIKWIGDISEQDLPESAGRLAENRPASIMISLFIFLGIRQRGQGTFLILVARFFECTT